jgi:hypothetical protein
MATIKRYGIAFVITLYRVPNPQGARVGPASTAVQEEVTTQLTSASYHSLQS